MSDRATLAKARKELEELYLGVPDDSVNLTFQDFAQISQNIAPPARKKKPNPPPTTIKKMDSISESTPKHDRPLPPPSHLAKVPSLDFSRGLEAASTEQHYHYHHHRQQNHHVVAEPPVVGLPPGRARHQQQQQHHVDESLQHGYKHGDVSYNYDNGHGHQHHHHAMKSPHHGGHSMMQNNSIAYDEMSMMSGVSMTSMYQEKKSGQRRPGVPHSNICTICSVYIYMFRNRCLVCGRVYCRQCINIGMGEMTEGRKCIDCLGRKFSQRYIHRAGDVGCWSSCFNGYPNGVKLQELKWAEKGPRRSGENKYNRSVMMSDSRSPLKGPRTPNRSHIVASGPPSFVTTPEYSPYSTPTRHHLPF